MQSQSIRLWSNALLYLGAGPAPKLGSKRKSKAPQRVIKRNSERSVVRVSSAPLRKAKRIRIGSSFHPLVSHCTHLTVLMVPLQKPKLEPADSLPTESLPAPAAWAAKQPPMTAADVGLPRASSVQRAASAGTDARAPPAAGRDQSAPGRSASNGLPQALPELLPPPDAQRCAKCFVYKPAAQFPAARGRAHPHCAVCHSCAGTKVREPPGAQNRGNQHKSLSVMRLHALLWWFLHLTSIAHQTPIAHIPLNVITFLI